MTLEYRIGDVRDRLAEIPDGSIDLIVTSPPFLALRSYLPADHPDKHREIGSEATPADFLDTLLGLSAEWGRVLAPHGSLCVELGDTFAGSGGAGGDYKPGGMRDGQGQFDGSSRREKASTHKYAGEWANEGYADKFKGGSPGGRGWPLAKSLTGIPTLYPWSLAYGRNLLTGQPSPAGQWRIRNLIVWARPNPPVGALGDKFRPATSYITVACRSAKRYFDLDAVRLEPSPNSHARLAAGVDSRPNTLKTSPDGNRDTLAIIETNGAPPLDWHADHHPEDGDWLWKLSTQPYAGSHYATFPMALPKRLIEAMCPLRVCTVCGRPSERVLAPLTLDAWSDCGCEIEVDGPKGVTADVDVVGRGVDTQVRRVDATLDAGHEGHVKSREGRPLRDHWRTGIVLDPFAGSGTTLEAAQAVGRHAIGIDLDSSNADLARDRVGMFLDIVGAA